MTCSVAGCDRPLAARGFCGGHYTRWLMHGDARPDAPIGELHLQPNPWRYRAPACPLGHTNRWVLLFDVKDGRERWICIDRSSGSSCSAIAFEAA